MSWSTIVDNDSSNKPNNNHQYLSEEAILHSLRCTYQTAMDNLSKSNFIGDDKWQLGKSILEKLSIKALSYLEKIPNVHDDLLEISYLSNRNRIDCLSKEETSNPEACYQLCLDLVYMMLDLHKHDSLLLLKTAEYALKVNDFWTYKQLTLIENAAVPYMYSNIIIKRFNANMDKQFYNIYHNYFDYPNENINIDQNKENILLNMQYNDSDQFFLSFIQKLLLNQDISYMWLVENTSSEVCPNVLDNGNPVIGDQTTILDSSMNEAVACGYGVDILTNDIVYITNQETIAVVISNKALADEAVVVDVPQSAVSQPPPSRRSTRKKLDQSEQQLLSSSITNGIPENSASIHKSGGISSMKELLQNYITMECYQNNDPHSRGNIALFNYIFVLPFDSIMSESNLNSNYNTNAYALNIDTIITTDKNKKSKIYSEYKICKLFQVLKQYSSISALDPAKVYLLSNIYIHFIDILAHQEYNEKEALNNYNLHNIDVLVLRCWIFIQENTMYNRNQLFENLDDYEVLILAECCLSIMKKHNKLRNNNYAEIFDQNFYSKVCKSFFVLLNVILNKHSISMLNEDNNNYHQIRFLWLLFWGSNESIIQLAHYSPLNNHYELLDIIKCLLIKMKVLNIVIPHLVDVSCNIIDAKICDELLASYKYKELISKILNKYQLCSAWIKEVLSHMNVENMMFFCNYQINPKEEYSHVYGIEQLSGCEVAGTTITLPVLILEACCSLLSPVLWWESLAVLMNIFQELNHCNNTIPSSIATTYESLLKDVLKKRIPFKIDNWDDRLVLQSNIMSVLHKMSFFLNKITTSTILPLDIVDSIIMYTIEIFSYVLEGIKECYGDTNAVKLISANVVHHIMHILFSTSSMQVLLCKHHISTTSALLLSCLWKFVCKIISESYLVLSSLPLSIIELLIMVSLQELNSENNNNGLHIALLYVLLSCVSHYPKLSTYEKYNMYLQCYLEIISLDSSDSDDISFNIIELIAKQLELLLYIEHDWISLSISEQKASCYLLGKLYYCLYDFPMVQSSSVEENLKFIAKNVQQDNKTKVAILYKLYLYGKFCIKTGFFSKSELRCSLLMIAKSKKFELAYSTIASQNIIKYLFEDCSALSDFNPEQLMLSLGNETSIDELDIEECVDMNMIREMATDLFELILLLGVSTTTTTFEEEKRLRPHPDILSNYASWGPLYVDQGNVILIDICLKDLAYNPFRYTTWMILRMRLIHSLNDTLDEMQKLFLIDQIPSYCYEIILPDSMHNLHPTKKVFDVSDVDLQQQILSELRNTIYNKLEQFLQSSQEPFEKFQNNQIFASSCAYQIFLNMNQSSISTDNDLLLPLNSECYNQYLQALIHLILLRNSLLLLLQRISIFVEYSSAHHKLLIEDYALLHSTEIAYSLLLYNVSNSYPERSQTRNDINKVIVDHLSKDNFLSNDIYALTMCAKLSWQNIDISSTATTTDNMNVSCQSYCVVLQLCIKLANIIISPLNKSSSLKSLKKSGFYQIYSICSKASLMIIQVIYDGKYDHNNNRDDILTLITLVEECYFILKTNFLFKKYGNIDYIEEHVHMLQEDHSLHSNDILQNNILHRSWYAVLRAIIGLKECRRIENYDFKSIYRITDLLQVLSNMKIQYNNENVIPDWFEFLCKEPVLLGSNSSSTISSSSISYCVISVQSSLEEMSKLFNRKVPQIISLWSMESNPINPWDKMLHRVSYFDKTRSLYTLKYLNLAKECNELEVIFDVLSYSIAAINECCHSVVFYIINKSIEALYDITSNLLSNDQQQQQEVLNNTMKSNSLKENADHNLQLIYEVYHKLIFSTKALIEIPIQNKLKYSIYILFPYSQLYKQSMEQGLILLPIDVIAVTIHKLSNNGNIDKDFQEDHIFECILNTCKHKWGKLNRTELGKRSRSYFVNIQNNSNVPRTNNNINNDDDVNDINNNNDKLRDKIEVSNVSDNTNSIEQHINYDSKNNANNTTNNTNSNNNNLESSVVSTAVSRDQIIPSKFARIDIVDSVLSLIMK